MVIYFTPQGAGFPIHILSKEKDAPTNKVRFIRLVPASGVVFDYVIQPLPDHPAGELAIEPPLDQLITIRHRAPRIETLLSAYNRHQRSLRYDLALGEITINFLINDHPM
ncbi:hypothetical protein WP12_02870 [Sphingomonas sp. SRS2]|nr:hypothetical protein WP12_02870 [Sphingomonas sp. SRS2]